MGIGDGRCLNIFTGICQKAVDHLPAGVGRSRLVLMVLERVGNGAEMG
jgi:hypothetical protein